MSNTVKYLILILGIVILYAALVTHDLNRVEDKLAEKEDYILRLESNLNYISNQLIKVQEAAEARELEYQQIDEEFDKKEKEVEQIKETDDDSKNWLLQAIPVAIDNTIPY
jgi:peptidoglycan hydrolase CwlO-like protein